MMNVTNAFTAIDFETAQGKRWSICRVGLVRIEDGILTRTINKLVRPPDNYYFYRHTDIHGISPIHTRNEPKFSVIWNYLLPYIHNQTVVAHNGAFDFSCLSQTLAFYGVNQQHINLLISLKFIFCAILNKLSSE